MVVVAIEHSGLEHKNMFEKKKNACRSLGWGGGGRSLFGTNFVWDELELA
eukprot:SAG31_NODE_43262_length_268_cov_0.360947_1_plen_49_part_10